MSEQSGEGVPGGSETESSPQPEVARDASGVAEGSAAGGVSTDAPVDPEPGTARAEEEAAKDPDGTKWIRASFSRRGLAFMLDRPVAAIWDEIYKLLGVLFGALFAVVFIFFLLFQAFGKAAVGGFDFHFHPKLLIVGFFISLYTALFLVVAYALAVLVPAVRPTLREWSKVDNRMALMLSFVALFFLTGDSWRLTASIPWWRLRSLVGVLIVVYICVLYRRAKRLIADVLEQPIKSADVPNSIKEKRQQIEQALSNIDGKKPPKIPRRPLVNLRVVAAILLSRRIIISAIIVSAILFAFGMILVSKQDTLSLMNIPSPRVNNHSPSVIGFTDTLGIRNYQFFLSESLLKVSLSLGTIAAAYFMFANPDPAPDPYRDKDTHVTTFIRKTIALWACYQHLARTAQPARSAAEETVRAETADAQGAPPD